MARQKKLNKSIGASIHELRANAKLTINDLAEQIGITPEYVRLIEHGERGTSLEHLLKICKIFCCSVEDLIKEQGILHGNVNDHTTSLTAFLTAKSMTNASDVNFLINVARAVLEYKGGTSND